MACGYVSLSPLAPNEGDGGRELAMSSHDDEALPWQLPRIARDAAFWILDWILYDSIHVVFIYSPPFFLVLAGVRVSGNGNDLFHVSSSFLFFLSLRLRLLFLCSSSMLLC